MAKDTPKVNVGNLIKDSSSYKELARNNKEEDLIENLESHEWDKVIDPPRTLGSVKTSMKKTIMVLFSSVIW